VTTEDRPDSDRDYAAFISAVFGLLERFDAETLRTFKARKPSLGPEFVRVVDALADLRATMIERRPRLQAIESDGAALTAEEKSLVDDVFRSRAIFPKNDDLKSFVTRALGLNVYGKNYSRSMIADSVIRKLNTMTAAERDSFIVSLGEFRKRILLADKPQDSFLRIWSRVIKGA
jgi:hypothetical protein